jgi:outer membrane protein OmpA-like peptidoglycan-associated protein
MSRCKSLSLALTLAIGGPLALTLAIPRSADAQIFQRARDAAKRKAEEALKGQKKDSTPADATKPAQNASTSGPGTTAAGGPQKEWANYDFVPGSDVLFFTDFTDDKVGNFPKRLDFRTGAMEIVQLENGQRALKASSRSELIIPLPKVLPEKFTIELGVIDRNTPSLGAPTFDLAGGRQLNDNKYTQVGWGHNGMYVSGGALQYPMHTARDDQYVGRPATFRVLADGSALKFYVDNKRLANIPNGNFRRDNALVLDLEGMDDTKASYVTSIRVAASQTSIYDDLASKGRWATQGILFDVGAANVKGESTPTLKDIAETLKAHPDLKIEIQGHTDNVGNAAANLKLSEDRANAVKEMLVKDYGVAAAQLTAKGYGSTKPIGPNTTVEGRANNRRVELVVVKP